MDVTSICELKRQGMSNWQPAVIVSVINGAGEIVIRPVVVSTVSPELIVTPFLAATTVPATGL